MPQHPRPAVRFGGGLQGWLFRFGAGFRFDATVGTAGMAHMRGVGASLVSFPGFAILRAHRRQVNQRKIFFCWFSTIRTIRCCSRFLERTEDRKRPAAFARILVHRHNAPSYRAMARSLLALIIFFGPAAFGRMSNSKISVGRKTVAQAFGISTMPLM